MKKDALYYRRPQNHTGKTIMFWYEDKLYGLVTNKVSGEKEIFFYEYNHRAMDVVKGFEELKGTHFQKTSIRNIFEASIVRER